MTREQATQIAVRRANEEQCNYVICKPTKSSPQWIAVSYKYFSKKDSIFVKEGAILIKPNLIKSTVATIDDTNASY